MTGVFKRSPPEFVIKREKGLPPDICYLMRGGSVSRHSSFNARRVFFQAFGYIAVKLYQYSSVDALFEALRAHNLMNECMEYMKEASYENSAEAK